MSVQETIKYLDEVLGSPSLIAYVAELRRRSVLELWRTGEASPSPEQTERLSNAEKALRRVAECEHPDVARAWFIGKNTEMQDDNGKWKEVSPAEAIRNGRYQAVMASATRLVSDAMS